MASESTLPAVRVLTGIRSRGLLPKVLVAVAFVLVVVGVIAHRYLSDRFSADGTAVAFVTALDNRDASTAWSLLVVNDQGQRPATSLVSESGLGAQVAQPDYPLAGISNVHVSTHSFLGLGAAAKVTIGFTRGGKAGSLELTLVEDINTRHLLFYPTWHVVEDPVVLTLKAPAGIGAISLDGEQLAAGAGTVAVFPGQHHVRSAPTPQFNLAVATVVADPASTGKVLISPTLTSTATPSAGEAIKAAFTACHQPSFRSDCPSQLFGQPITWQVIGDPTASAVYSVGTDGQLQAQGHYQMLGTVSFVRPEDRSHTFAGGPYTAKLQLKDGAFSVTDLSDGPASVPAVVRPVPATDEAVKAAVLAAFNSCAAATTARPIDCPQVAHSSYGTIQNLKWTLNGDPTANATVTFDSSSGLFHVAGSYRMLASYDLAFVNTSHEQQTDAGMFDAQAVWAGNAAEVVEIKGGG